MAFAGLKRIYFPMNKILVTGCAGFIGFSLIKSIVNNYEVVGIDNINDYYDVQLKKDRLRELGIDISDDDLGKEIRKSNGNFKFIKLDLIDTLLLDELFSDEKFDYVIHLAAQAGVRYSIENPKVYVDSNIIGSFNILENVKKHNIKHLIFASSSSVYGRNIKQPFSEKDITNKPVSIYAATKISIEAMAYSYSENFKLKITTLRFFTVYGPWGRPDMAYFSFTNAILKDKPIKVYNKGNLARDFTYIDDIIDGIKLVLSKAELLTDNYNLFNIGSGKKIRLLKFIETLENVISKKAIKDFVQMQNGDVNETFADISNISAIFNYSPKTDFKSGILQFFEWYKKYFKIEI